jgi:hypothetical protein
MPARFSLPEANLHYTIRAAWYMPPSRHAPCPQGSVYQKPIYQNQATATPWSVGHSSPRGRREGAATATQLAAATGSASVKSGRRWCLQRCRVTLRPVLVL